MTRTGTIEGTRFTDTAGHRFSLDKLIGREYESGVYDTFVLASLDGADPQRGEMVVIEDREDEAVMCW